MIGQIIFYIFIWIALSVVFLVIFISLIAKYFYDVKNNKIQGDDIKNTLLRICIYLVLGVLLLILLPVIFGAFM